jgi:hypothetical protein
MTHVQLLQTGTWRMQTQQQVLTAAWILMGQMQQMQGSKATSP